MNAAPGQLGQRQVLTILAALMLGMFLAALDQTVVATAIRVIGDDLHDLSAQAWVTTAFLITSTISTPLYGKLSDIYGRKPFFLFAITIFVSGSVLCSFATSMYELAAFRAFQGIGAGGLFTLALAILSDIVAPRERAKYQGYFIAVFGTSSVLGPLIGGFLSGQESILGMAGWRWIFLVNVPIGILALTVVALTLKLPKRPPREHSIDYTGAVLLVLGLVPLLLVAEQGRTWGWGSPGSLACYAVAIGAIAAFIRVEARRGADALLPLSLFRSRVFSLASVQTALIGVGMFGAISVLPLYLQIVKGASPTESGLLTLPLVAGIMVASTVSGLITSRTGHYRVFPIIGTATMVLGMLMLWRIKADSTYVYTDSAMALVGLGVGLNMQTLTLAMQNSVSAADIGVATSTSTFFRQIGGTLGVAAFLSILYSTLPTQLKSSFAAAGSEPAFRAAATAKPAALKLLHSPAVIDNTNVLNRLPDVLTAPWKSGFTEAISLLFLVGAIVVALSFFLALLTEEVPLRTAADLGTEEASDAPAGTGEPQLPTSGAEAEESPHPASPVSTRKCRGRRATAPG